MGTARRGTRNLYGFLLTALVAAGFVAPAQAAAGLELLAKPSGPLPVKLGPARDGTRRGRLAFVVRNASDQQEPLQLRYLRDDGSEPVKLNATHPSDPGIVELTRPLGSDLTLEPHEVEQLVLSFQLGAAEDPSKLDGSVLLERAASIAKASAPPGNQAGGTAADPTQDSQGPLVVGVSGQLEAPSATVDQGSVTLQLTRWLPSWLDVDDPDTGNTTTVLLRGAGAPEVAASARQHDGRVILHNSSGDSAEVQWKLVSGQRGEAAPKIEIQVLGDPPAGEYTGSLPLSSAADEPKIDVTVKVHDQAVWAFVTVFIGALLWGLIPLLGGLARRRGLLRGALRGVVEAYQAQLHHHPPASYSLDEALGPEAADPESAPWNIEEWMAMPRLRGAAGLFSSIHWARSDVDLDEDGQWVNELTTRVQRWIRIETEAAELQQRARYEPEEIGDKKWSETGVWRDSQRLLLMVRDEPTDNATADVLVQRLKWQNAWHESVARIWDEILGLPPGSDRTARGTELQAIASPTDPNNSEEKRNADQRRELQLDLLELHRRMGEPADQAIAAATATALASAPAPVIMSGPVETGATLPLDLIAHVENATQEELPGSGRRRSASQFLRAITLRDIGLTLLLAAGATIVYLVPVYSATWGGTKDYVTALMAGFGAQPVIQWALLPAFTSLRNRVAKTKTKTPDTGISVTATPQPPIADVSERPRI